jgi:Tol biopolymer transport system component
MNTDNTTSKLLILYYSDPVAVGPIFSPDSQRIFFQSDREGKPAIYRIRVEKFVEETDG